MANSQNGWPVLSHSQTFKWIIPVKKGEPRHLILAPGYVGFILAHFVLWYHEVIEAINVGTWDEWGWAPRPIRGSSVISNHASGTAADVNATKHPLGVLNTLNFLVFRKKAKEPARMRIARVLKNRYAGVLRGGFQYTKRKDAMHYEINTRDRAKVARVAKRLAKTPRGKRILAANPGYRA